MHSLHWWYWIVVLVVLAGYVWWSSRWSTRAKLIRRIVFYILVLAYIVVHVAVRKHDALAYATFAAVAVYAVAQLIEDVTTMRKKEV